jgi:hypothetical protein
MYADAIRILWTYNRIIIYPWASQRSLCQTFPLQDATRFLKQHQWPHILHRLRTLELALDDVPFESLLSEPKVNAWCSAVAHFRDYANVEKLTIIIHITRSYILSRYFNCGGRRLVGILKRRALSDKELKVALGGHARYLEPLKSLRLMKRFFVHLETLRASRVGRYVRNEEELESIRLNLRSIETWLEKFVMGKEYYSGALGKGEQQPSQWLEIFPHGRD